MKEIPRVRAIAAIGRNRELGYKNELLWRIPEDLARFKELTMGHPMIMGRKTFDSIGRVLPGRVSIVVTRDKDWSHEGVLVAHSVEEAIRMGKELDHGDVFIVGGAEIYRQALPQVEALHLTLISATAQADAHFPEYVDMFAKKTYEEDKQHGEIRYRWLNLER